MRILLDQNVPAILCRFLTGHTALHSSHLGWSRLANGDLIAAAEREDFDVLVTADKNIPHQQSLAKTRLAIVILGNNSWPVLEPHVADIVARITSVSPGTLIAIPISRPPLRRRPFFAPKT